MEFKDLKLGMKCIFKCDGDIGIINGIKNDSFSVNFGTFTVRPTYVWIPQDLRFFDFKSAKFDEDIEELLK